MCAKMERAKDLYPPSLNIPQMFYILFRHRGPSLAPSSLGVAMVMEVLPTGQAQVLVV